MAKQTKEEKKREKQLNTLVNNWRVVKREAVAKDLEEKSLRAEIALLTSELKVVVGSEVLNFKTGTNHAVPKAGVTAIKRDMDTELFEELFGATYKMKPTVYATLKGKDKKLVDKYLTIKDTPLTCTIKDV